MDTAVVFDSPQFSPFLPDDSQVNPGVHGAELDSWLSRELAARGVVTSYPNEPIPPPRAPRVYAAGDVTGGGALYFAISGKPSVLPTLAPENVRQVVW